MYGSDVPNNSTIVLLLSKIETVSPNGNISVSDDESVLVELLMTVTVTTISK